MSEQQTRTSPTTPIIEKTFLGKVNARATQFFLSIVAAVLVVIVGSFLTMTGVGAILGIPLIIAGVCLPFWGLLGKVSQMIQGSCPFCETKVVTTIDAHGVWCRGCKKRLVVRDRQLVGID